MHGMCRGILWVLQTAFCAHTDVLLYWLCRPHGSGIRTGCFWRRPAGRARSGRRLRQHTGSQRPDCGLSYCVLSGTGTHKNTQVVSCHLAAGTPVFCCPTCCTYRAEMQRLFTFTHHATPTHHHTTTPYIRVYQIFQNHGLRTTSLGHSSSGALLQIVPDVETDASCLGRDPPSQCKSKKICAPGQILPSPYCPRCMFYI